jgi:DNA-directed RNA polymerase specialized sigma24 family protein
MTKLPAANEADDYGVRAPERVAPRELAGLLATLPPGRRRVAMALVADDRGRTYPEVAEILGVHLGSVHQHLRRIRLRHPKIYATIMKARARQLRARHRQALAREKAHSKRWHELTKDRYFRPPGS